MGIILQWFYVSFTFLRDWNIENFQKLTLCTLLGKLGPKGTSCKVCSVFKLHFSFPLNKGKKIQSSN